MSCSLTDTIVSLPSLAAFGPPSFFYRLIVVYCCLFTATVPMEEIVRAFTKTINDGKAHYCQSASAFLLRGGCG